MEFSLHGHLLISWSYSTSLALCTHIANCVDTSNVGKVSRRSKAIVYHLPHVLSFLVVWSRSVNWGSVHWRIASQGLIPYFLHAVRSSIVSIRGFDLSSFVRKINTLLLELLYTIEGFLLEQLVHAVKALVVLMKSSWLFSGEGKLFLLKIVNSLQVVSISLELAILLLNVLSEGLLVF